MATKNTAANAVTTEEPIYNNEKIPVTIPRMGVNEDPYVLVCVNMETVQIPRGKPVMVDRKTYEALQRADSVKDITESFLVQNAYTELGR